jgi:large subunit ribosomal protein L15
MSMIHEITAKSPRYKRPTRKGRGESSGHGKTAGKGTKGAGARSGGPYWKPGHEGGQTPLFRRLPARGFSNADFATRWHIVNLSQLQALFADGSTVDANGLIEAGLIPDAKRGVKVLGDGELKKKLTVHAGWYSKSAAEKIATAGGTLLTTKGQPFAFPKPKKKFIPREPVKKVKAETKAEAPAEAAAAAAAPAVAAAPEAEAK